MGRLIAEITLFTYDRARHERKQGALWIMQAAMDVQMRAEDILSCALDIGEHMLNSNAEVYRVEETISRVCYAYGMERVDAFAIPNSIVVTLTPKDGRPVTQTRRIKTASTNLDRVEHLNQLSREICRTTPEPEEVRRRVAEITQDKKQSIWWTLGANIISTSGFSAFFGGSWRDVIAAGFAGLIVTILQKFMKVRSSNVLYNVILSAVTGACAYFSVKWGLADNVDKIVIGGIMLFIPGMEMTNGIRDMMWGDIFAGLSHLCEAIIIAVGIAVGAAGTVAILGGLLG